MEKMRKPFQGVTNIIRFNWHFYVLALVATSLLATFSFYTDTTLKIYTSVIALLIISSTLISLSVSFYVYDLSDLYQLKWLDNLSIEENGLTININAGFDETSHLLKEKFKNTELTVMDFYNPLKHTEISIKRARKLYPSHLGTIAIETSALSVADHSADNVFVIFAAHEIRNENERIVFFKELNRVLKASGQIIITEHLRDVPNFFAYNIGFFHFYRRKDWKRTFQSAGLQIAEEIKVTPFISTFILKPDGNSF
jgi:ubiquinone/menaquinone biosynthesis C-methylase UbiE